VNQYRSRREFLSRMSQMSLGLYGLPTLLMSSSLLFKPKPVFGQDTDEDPHFFIFFRVGNDGGLDVTLGLDPRVREELPRNIDDRHYFLEAEDDILVDQKTGIRFGPSARPLAKFADRCALINGIDMNRNFDHPTARGYIMSGLESRNSATIAAEIARSAPFGPDGLIFNGRSLSLGSDSRPLMTKRLSDYFKTVPKSDRNKFDGLTVFEGISSRSEFETLPKDASGLELAKYYYAESRSGGPNLVRHLEAIDRGGGVEDGHIVAAAFKFGMARQAEITLSGFFDTHDNHPGTHLRDQRDKIWQRIADVLDILSRTTYGETDKRLIDMTTIMFGNEFARTAGLVDGGGTGKEHNPYTNSVLIAGKGVNPGVYGASVFELNDSAYYRGQLRAAFMDFEDGSTYEKDSRRNLAPMRPENVIRTIAKIFGDPDDFRLLDLSRYDVIPGLVKV